MRRRKPTAGLLCAVAGVGMLAGSASALPITRASVATGGTQATGGAARRVALSEDGRHVFFSSSATNLVPAQFPGGTTLTQLFAHDRDPDGNGVYDEGNGVTTLMSIGIDGLPGNNGGGPDGQNGSLDIDCSADGRFVVWASGSRNLVAGDLSGFGYNAGSVYHWDTFVRDRDPDGNGVFDEGNGVTTRMTAGLATPFEANSIDNTLDRLGMSGDGGLVVFSSQSSNIAQLDLNDGNRPSAFVRDVGAGFTSRVDWPYTTLLPVDVNTGSRGVDISADGRWIAYASKARHLVPGDTVSLGPADIFVYDRTSSPPNVVRTVRVTVNDLGVPGDDDSGVFLSDYQPQISGNGRLVAYWSRATNLDVTRNPLPTLSTGGIFVSDRDADGNGVFDEAGGTTTRRLTNRAVSPMDAAAGAGFWPAVDFAGSRVLFQSVSSELVVPDTNGANGSDIFMWERSTGALTLISRDASGVQGNSTSTSPAISADGRWAAFISRATNLVPGDTNSLADVFVVDLGALCVADITGDGVLNVFDVLAFFDAFGVGNALVADFNADGALNIFDILAFFAAFGAGC